MIDSVLGDQVIDKFSGRNKHSPRSKETGVLTWFAIAPNRETMPDPRATSQFCALYSFTGILFMVRRMLSFKFGAIRFPGTAQHVRIYIYFSERFSWRAVWGGGVQ